MPQLQSCNGKISQNSAFAKRPKSLFSSLVIFVWLKTFIVLFSLKLHAAGSNNLALLAGTLKTFQRHACQGSVLPLQCPDNTTIDILHANYGGAQPPLCPFLPGRNRVPSDNDQRGRCDYPMAVNYKVIESVVNRCHRKQNCTFDVPEPSDFSKEDPCPHSNKYVEVVFKCRPDTFLNKVICQGKELTLDCGQQSKIAIYSTMFGRTKDGSILCPQTAGLPEDDCLATFAIDNAMDECHGRTRCRLRASPDVFGRPCPPEYNMYMKTVYTCVPSWILKSPDVTKTSHNLSGSQVSQTTPPMVNTIGDQSSKMPPPENESKITKLNSTRRQLSTSEILNCTVAILSGSQEVDVGLITRWMKTIAFLNKNFEKFMLYLILGTIVGVLLLVIAVTFKLLKQQKTLKSNARDVGHFIGAIDDVDADVDMISQSLSEEDLFSPATSSTRPGEPSTSRMNSASRGHSSNIRASEVRPSLRFHDVDLLTPRSLSQSNDQYLYK